ncbi:MAG: Spy/CpxP family protein refolding chaperone, partial [Acidobacteria bacterium]|nr:Spy/CpxP family protein refolding chaperone [Acidobacteriota bacterium]
QHEPKPEHRSKLIRCLTILDLDEGQRVQIREIMETARPSFEKLREDGEAARDALRNAFDSGADECSIGAAALEVHQNRSAIQEFRDNLKKDVLAVLTIQQQAKLSGCLEAPGRGHKGPDDAED